MSATAFQRRRRIARLKAQQEQATNSEKPLDKMSVPELKELAKEKGIEGYENMKKAELIEALKGDAE